MTSEFAHVALNAYYKTKYVHEELYSEYNDVKYGLEGSVVTIGFYTAAVYSLDSFIITNTRTNTTHFADRNGIESTFTKYFQYVRAVETMDTIAKGLSGVTYVVENDKHHVFSMGEKKIVLTSSYSNNKFTTRIVNTDKVIKGVDNIKAAIEVALY